MRANSRIEFPADSSMDRIWAGDDDAGQSLIRRAFPTLFGGRCIRRSHEPAAHPIAPQGNAEKVAGQVDATSQRGPRPCKLPRKRHGLREAANSVGLP